VIEKILSDVRDPANVILWGAKEESGLESIESPTMVWKDSH
jgi:hypothetical protein